MRILLALALACCSLTGVAVAQQVEVSVARREAARELLHAMYIENQALEVAARGGFEQSGREIWSSLSTNSGFSAIAAEKREAVHAYLMTRYPQEATDDVVQNAPVVLDRYSDRFAVLLSEPQLQETRAFVLSAAGRAVFIGGIGGADYTPSEAETQALQEFTATSAGRVWVDGPTRELVMEVTAQLIVTRAEGIRARVLDQICEILGSDCPPGFAPGR